MQLDQVKQQILAGEGQRVEFKTGFAEAREAIETLCAFAHSAGGTVFFGVRDDGIPVGVDLGRKTLEDFANRVRTNTQSPLTPQIDSLTIDGRIVVAVTVEQSPSDSVHWAYNIAFVRVGKTNQVMSPDQITNRLLSRFSPAALGVPTAPHRVDESWDEREQRRIGVYRRNRGLFLVHTWRPSSQRGQVADVVIYLRQHGDPEQDDCPLSHGLVKSVEYHLGPRFSDQTMVQTNREENFRVEVSAYAPMLCLARVNFEDGKPAIDLEHYVDF